MIGLEQSSNQAAENPYPLLTLDIDPLTMAIESTERLRAIGLSTTAAPDIDADTLISSSFPDTRIIKIESFVDRPTDTDRDITDSQGILASDTRYDQDNVQSLVPTLDKQTSLNEPVLTNESESQAPVVDMEEYRKASQQLNSRTYRDIIRRAQAGDSYALEKACAAALPLIRHIAFRSGIPMPMDELQQVALIRFHKAIMRFKVNDPSTNFIAYMWGQIKGAMIDEQRKETPISRGDLTELREIAKLDRDDEERRTRLLDMVKRGFTIAPQLLDGENVVLSRMSTELEKPIVNNSGDEFTIADVTASDFDVVAEIINESESEELFNAIERLPERERFVFKSYYGLFEDIPELNLREIGEYLGVTESRVSQIHTRAIKRVKSFLGLPED